MRRITFWLALIIIFIVPWEDSITLAAVGSIVKIMGLILAAFWGATILIEGRFRKPNFFHVLVLLFFLWNFLSVLWTTDIPDTIQRITTYSQIFLLMLIFWEVFQKPEGLNAGMQAYVFGAYIPIISTINNYIQGNVAVQFEGRYSASGVNAVDLAIILMIGLPFALQLFFKESQNKKGTILKFFNFAYIPLAIFSIVLTGSRTSLIAIIPFGFYFFLTRQIKFGRKVFIFGILVISLLILYPFIPASVTARLSTLGTSIETGDLSGRVEYWRQAILIFSTHPFIGLGGGTMVSAIGSAVHNTFLSVAAETGFIGFLLFFIILSLTFFQCIE